MDDGFSHSSKKSIQRKSKKCLAHISPEKLTFSGNFTSDYKLFDIRGTEKRASMRQDILNTVIKRTESRLLEGTDDVPCKLVEENPMYEDPRDVIVACEKPPKPPRKRNAQATSPRPSRSLLKEQKRKLSRKYEALVSTLIARCEESVVTISEKDAYILKLKDKLKAVLEYNKQFASENDQLKSQHAALVRHAEECRAALRRARERPGPPKDPPDIDVAAIPLVEVCMNCSRTQILLAQAREQSAALQRDARALKDALYRLNGQLSRYQAKLRAQPVELAADNKTDRQDLDSLLTTSLGYRAPEAANTEDGQSKSGTEDPPPTSRVVDLSGLLSAQALAPLFDAYQENLQEKDTLILDYEKQFESMNSKSKQIVADNKSLRDKVATLEEELARVRQSYRKLVLEKETGDVERATSLERAERAESKLKEVYELYEDKMAAMMRDYETVHREYFALKHALEAASGKVDRTVPAELHERRLDHCKRLLEELKHQYSMETERKTEMITKLQEQLRAAEDRCSGAERDLHAAREELSVALKNVRLYRKAAVVFRQRARAARGAHAARARARRTGGAGPLQQALDTLERIKKEIKEVKSRAHSSLEELERRMVQQERRAGAARAQHRRELERAALALQHKEDIIRRLIDNVADVEEVRLSQTNAHRLQGIVSDSSPEHTGSDRPGVGSDRHKARSNRPDKTGSDRLGTGSDGHKSRSDRPRTGSDRPERAESAGPDMTRTGRPEDKSGVKLVPGAGGYFQEDRGRKKGKA